MDTWLNHHHHCTLSIPSKYEVDICYPSSRSQRMTLRMGIARPGAPARETAMSSVSIFIPIGRQNKGGGGSLCFTESIYLRYGRSHSNGRWPCFTCVPVWACWVHYMYTCNDPPTLKQVPRFASLIQNICCCMFICCECGWAYESWRPTYFTVKQIWSLPTIQLRVTFQLSIRNYFTSMKAIIYSSA